MTNREFVQAKFGIFVLMGMAAFFTTIEMLLLVIDIWHPLDLASGLGDWILKAAIGPTIGALLNAIITPHQDARREDSTEYVNGKGTTTVHAETTVDKVIEPKTEPPKETT